MTISFFLHRRPRFQNHSAVFTVVEYEEIERVKKTETETFTILFPQDVREHIRKKQ